MPDQPNAGSADVLEADEVARLVLGVLLVRHPALVAVEELVREFGTQDRDRSMPEMFIQEGVDELVCSGLAHRLDRFVFASYSAVRAQGMEM